MPSCPHGRQPTRGGGVVGYVGVLRKYKIMRISRHSNVVEGIATWLVIENEKDFGLEGDSHVFRFFVQPEVKLPRKNLDGQFQWSSSDAAHLVMGDQAANRGNSGVECGAC